MKNKGGRPPKITKDVLAKLEDAFRFTYTDEEACLYAGINPSTLYRYQERNPEFSKRKEQLRLAPNLVAKQVLVEGLQKNLEQAKWWATHKMPEFRPTQKVEHSGVITTASSEGIEMSPKMKEAVRLFNEGLKEQVISEIKAMP